MKLNLLAWLTADEGETIARSGTARLVKQRTGKIELIGGSRADRADAQEWYSMFLHEATFAHAA